MADPILAEQRELMNSLARRLDELFNGEQQPSRVGFVLLTFNFGNTEGGRVNYISNGDRQTMITAMKEWLARAEGRVAETSGALQ